MKKNISLILIAAIFSFIFNYFPSAYCEEDQQKQSIALLDFEFKGISQEEAGIITDRFRAYLVNADKFKVMERSNMDKIFKEQGFQQTEYCNTSECEIKIGQLLSVDLIITGSVSRTGNLFSINATIIDVQTGLIIKNASDACNCPIEDVLYTSTKNVAYKIMDENTKVDNSLKVKRYKQEEKWWGAAMLLNAIPLTAGGYAYINDWGWFAAVMATQIAGIFVSFKDGKTGSLMFLGAWGFGFLHAPFSTMCKNWELMKKYGITDADIRKYSATKGIVEFYADRPDNGLYLDFSNNLGIFYKLNF